MVYVPSTKADLLYHIKNRMGFELVPDASVLPELAAIKQNILGELERQPKSVLENIYLYECLSQKARGVTIYQNYIPCATYATVYPHGAFPYVLPSKGTVQKGFARPCPLTPRHGFVESRPISSYRELIEVFKETRAHDPMGEVLVMPKLTGLYSAVATNAGISFGFGNDGATSGASTFVPAPTTVEKWNRTPFEFSAASNLVKMGINDTTYYELVENEGRMSIVQRRDGPAQQVEQNYIPRDTAVERTITMGPMQDLIKWETLIKKTPIKGTVVHLPGQTLSSHYAVHAIERGLVVITDDTVPKVLTKTQHKTVKMTPQDYKHISLEIGKYLTNFYVERDRYNKLEEVCATAVATIHAQGQWGTEKHLLDLRAFAVFGLARLLHGVCAGEMRHGGAYGIEGLTYGSSRHANYSAAFEIGVKRSISDLDQMVKDFSRAGWSGSFGGKKWAKVARLTRNLYKAIDQFRNRPSRTNWTKVMMKANVALHTAHNTGRSLNKHIPTQWLTKLGNAPGYGFFNTVAAQIVLGQPIKL